MLNQPSFFPNKQWSKQALFGVAYLHHPVACGATSLSHDFVIPLSIRGKTLLIIGRRPSYKIAYLIPGTWYMARPWKAINEKISGKW